MAITTARTPVIVLTTQRKSPKTLSTLRTGVNADEIDLVRRCQSGSRRAQQQLYGRYVNAMYHTSLRMVGNAADAEDVIQEMFIRVFSNLHTFQGDATLGAWIKKICINTNLNFMRKTQRFKWSDLNERTELVEMEEEKEMPKWNLKQIHEAIKTLPEGCRVVFNLYLLEGYQHQEIAEILSISESTSKTQYRRAKRLLQQKLK